MDIPKIQVNSTHVQSIGTTRVFVQDIPRWLTEHPPGSIPWYPPATVIIGQPIIDMPGCVEAHEFSNRSNTIIEDDEDNVLVFCDAEVPSYDAMDYEPDQLLMELEATPPPTVDPPPEVDPPEVPPTGDLAGEVPCPGPANLRVGDLTQAGDEKVIGHELQGTVCVTLYEPTSAAEKFLPSVNQSTTTVAIAVLATAGAAATPLLLRAIKPIIKKLTTTVKKKLGKKVIKPSRQDIITDKYREKKGLPPIKR